MQILKQIMEVRGCCFPCTVPIAEEIVRCCSNQEHHRLNSVSWVQHLTNGAVSAVSFLLSHWLSAFFFFPLYIGDPAYTSQGDRSVTHKPGATAQSPTSAPPQAPTLGDQMESKRPDQPHLNVSLQNEVMWPTERWALPNVQNKAKKGTESSWMASVEMGAWSGCSLESAGKAHLCK